MSDLDFHKMLIRPIICSIDENGNEVHTVQMELYDAMYRKSPLSEAWVAGNLLLFTIFDGYLENKYSLREGVSFRKHYDALPENTPIERISCKCQYKNAQKVENKNVHFPMLYSSACVSKKDRFSLSRYDGPFIETICE